MKRILVTGARGFIGRHALGPLKERGYEIVAATAATSGADPGNVARWIRCDLLERGSPRELVAEAQPTHLLHLAWYTEHGKFWDGAANLRWVGASLELLKAFVAAGGRRAVIAGSCAEYDWSASSPCHEFNTSLAPRTLYGTCKKALFEIGMRYAELSGISFAWGRLFHLHGPNEIAGRFVPSLIGALIRGQPAAATHGRQLRDILYVADAAAAMAALADSDVTGPVNIGSGMPVRLLDVAMHIAGRLGRVDLLRTGALPPRPDEPEKLYPNVDRLRHEVCWIPSLALHEGLDQSIAWWQQNLADEGLKP